jgi:hypothetical protein
MLKFSLYFKKIEFGFCHYLIKKQLYFNFSKSNKNQKKVYLFESMIKRF